MTSAFIALGSNLEPRLDHLRMAIHHLRRTDGLVVEKLSALYENPAMTPPGADPSWNRPFLNGVVKIKWARSAHELLAELKKIEKQLGRENRQRWSPREIDLDILLFGDEVIDEEGLTVPHPGLRERGFFLAPLKEVAPDLDLPVGSPGLTRFMHILNLTPDSFSDGGENTRPEVWRQQLETLRQSQVAIIDIGGESTAPRAPHIAAEEEWQRLRPFFDFYRSFDAENPFRAKLSVDTWKATVAAQALTAGAAIVNDVSGLKDPEMAAVLKNHDCEYVLMHSLTVPADPNVLLPESCDVIAELKNWLESKLEVLERNGIRKERVYFDPGIGFGKSKFQSLEILRRIDELAALPVRLLVGASRKSFMNVFTNGAFGDRDPESLAISLHLAGQSVDIVRVHRADLHARAYLSWLHLQKNVASPSKL